MPNNNNSEMGFTIQKTICDMYGIVPESERATTFFDTNYDAVLSGRARPYLQRIFDELGTRPISCHTFEKVDGCLVPYNFILEDNSTLSVRTNFKGDKIAPREVGQAGFDKLNEHFGAIYGRPIVTQQDIKQLFIDSVDEVLPVFIDYLMDADHILWIRFEDGQFTYDLFEGNGTFIMDFERENFTFTRGLDEWVESTTLKYRGTSIAEIQIHKNRSFKFRFIMGNMMPLLRESKVNNETLGITAELLICGEYGLDYPPDLRERGSASIGSRLRPSVRSAFQHLPRPIRYTGNEKGSRGKRSKCPYDFVLEGNKTLSVKTNYGQKVCPPEVGQPSAETCYMYFDDFINGDRVTEESFKRMVFDHIQDIIPIYLSHLFDSDYLLRIRESPPGSGTFIYSIVEKDTGVGFHWEPSKFSFTQPTMEQWNESNTVRYDDIPLGEFQVHKHRNCYKFRFNFDNLLKILGST